MVCIYIYILEIQRIRELVWSRKTDEIEDGTMMMMMTTTTIRENKRKEEERKNVGWRLRVGARWKRREQRSLPLINQAGTTEGHNCNCP